MTQSIDLTFEVRSTDGAAAEFYQSDAERVAKALPLASPSSVATLRNGEAHPSCIDCRAEIVDNHWFCRLPQNGNGDAHAESVSILLCCPRCALRHFETLRPRGNGFEFDYEQYKHTVIFLIDGDKPAWL